MLSWYKENAISTEEAKKISEEDLAGKIVVGDFVNRKRPTLEETIQGTLREARRK
jgi:2-oxoglutarate ferredoxin oxidoreductase subunit beta